ncbi:MAG TPA: hypothetical protein VII13_00235 [Vicinamibacteria bacterium]
MSERAPSELSDADLVAALARRAQGARGATVGLVVHLAELDARRLHLAAGFPSLFVYATEALRLSEHDAYNQIEAARMARRFPEVVARLADGSLNLATLRLLAPHLTAGNAGALLAAARGRTRRELEEVLARRYPQPDVPPQVRKLPAPPATLIAPCVPGAGAPWPATTPRAPGRYEVRMTVGAETVQKLRRAQDLLRHSLPAGDPALVVDRALAALLEQLARGKLACTERPRAGAPPAAGSRHVPATVRRAVWTRDGGRCAFTAASGRRCAAKGFLEFHHVQPYGAGGEATAGNIQLRCRAHNAYEAELFYGADRRPGTS